MFKSPESNKLDNEDIGNHQRRSGKGFMNRTKPLTFEVEKRLKTLQMRADREKWKSKIKVFHT